MRARYNVPKHTRNKIVIELYHYWENKRQLEEDAEEDAIDIIESSPLRDETGIKSKYQISKPTENKAIKIADLSTRLLVEASKRIRYIDNAMSMLNEEDKKVVEYIFKYRYSQIRAYTEKHITKDTYYNVKSKIIYYTAIEFGEI